MCVALPGRVRQFSRTHEGDGADLLGHARRLVYEARGKAEVDQLELGERVVGLVGSTTHVVDIGGRGFGPDATQVFEEGLCAHA